eukprot:4418541-Lingulodinium_polyedra.AAC.1
MEESGLTAEELCQDPEKAGKVVGCVVLVPEVRCNGNVLQVLTGEQRFLSECHGRTPGLFLRIAASAWLDSPVQGVCKGVEISPHCLVYAVTRACTTRLLDAPAADGRLMRDVLQEFIGAHPIPAIDDLSKVNSCFQLNGPLLHCVQKGGWATLFLPDTSRVEADAEGRAFLSFAGWQNTRGQAAAAGGGNLPSNMTPASLYDLADHFRMLAAHVLGEREILDLDAERQRLERDVQWLESHALVLENVGDGHLEGFGRYGFQRRYRLNFLISVFLFSGLIRN